MDIGTQQLRAFGMPFWTSRRGKAVSRRGIDDHGHTMRADRFNSRITFWLIVLHSARDGIRHRMRKMTTGVTKTDPCQSRRVHHGMACFVVSPIVDRPDQVLSGLAQGFPA